MVLKTPLHQAARTPLALVRRIAEAHAAKSPDLQMVMAIWLNPTDSELAMWREGIDLLEICRNVVKLPEPDFSPMVFGGGKGRPELRLSLTSPGELSVAWHMEEGSRGFVADLRRRLRTGRARVVYPRTVRPGMQSRLFTRLLDRSGIEELHPPVRL